jgi:hypothetical protein
LGFLHPQPSLLSIISSISNLRAMDNETETKRNRAMWDQLFYGDPDTEAIYVEVSRKTTK